MIDEELDDITDVEEDASKAPIMGATTGDSFADKNKWHRYIDEACSGNAYVVNYKPDNHPALTCANCGAALTTFKPENIIPLNEDEVRSIEAIQHAS